MLILLVSTTPNWMWWVLALVALLALSVLYDPGPKTAKEKPKDWQPQSGLRTVPPLPLRGRDWKPFPPALRRKIKLKPWKHPLAQYATFCHAGEHYVRFSLRTDVHSEFFKSETIKIGKEKPRENNPLCG